MQNDAQEPNEEAPPAAEPDETGEATDQGVEPVVARDGENHAQEVGALDTSPPPADASDLPDASDAPLIATSDDSALDDLIGAEALVESGSKIFDWLRTTMLTLDTGLQAGLLAAAIIPSFVFGPQIKRLIDAHVEPRMPHGALRRIANAFGYVATPIALYVVLQTAVLALKAAGRPSALVEAGVSMLTAFIVIRLVTLIIRSPFWSRTAFYIAWPVAALDAFGALDDVLRELDALSVPLGENDAGEPITFSLLDAARTLIIFAVLFWIAGFANRFLKARIATVEELTPSFQALIVKILDIVTPVLAFLLALQIVGFKLATLTIFGGAVGLGIGLGLQRTVSNFIAGFTLIADRSIKPGDVIEVGDTFGWVTQLSGRYVSVRTRDGTAHLVPNEKFIENGVVNWSHSDNVVRLHAPFGVSYATADLRAVKAAAEETARGVDRVVERPAPVCNLVGFGDSSVDFDLRFWIADPANGIGNVRSAVFLALWDRLREMEVEIPFPQRDLHIKTAPPPTQAEGAYLDAAAPSTPATPATPDGEART